MPSGSIYDDYFCVFHAPTEIESEQEVADCLRSTLSSGQGNGSTLKAIFHLMYIKK